MTELIGKNKEKSIRAKLKLVDAKTLKPTTDHIPPVIQDSISNACQKISPFWDITEYVAVNPFFGFRNNSFLETAIFLQGISGHEIVPKKDYFLKKYQKNEISEHDLKAAIKLVQLDGTYPSSALPSSKELIDFLHSSQKNYPAKHFHCVSDMVDASNNSSFSLQITNEISKWLAAYFDEGQATWHIPREGKRLFAWWKSLIGFDIPFEKDVFSRLLASLPENPAEAVESLTLELFDEQTIWNKDLSDYYYRLLYSVLGWSSYVQKFEFLAKRSGDTSKLTEIGGLIDLLAIRLAYDVALNRKAGTSKILLREKKEVRKKTGSIADLDFSFLWLTAAECAYRRQTKNLLLSKEAVEQKKAESKARYDAQMVFCIDVRSEAMRRHLELLNPNVQTIGFAGFFGLPISLKRLGHQQSHHNCPVLLNPLQEIRESAQTDPTKLINKIEAFARKQRQSKETQHSVSSSFSFVETLGFSFIFKMLATGLGFKKPDLDVHTGGLSIEDQKSVSLDLSHLSLEEKTTLAYGALKNMGLTKNFAKVVFLFGHGSESANNPYASALDCGACAGHNGFSNAKALAQLLNDKEVRQALNNREITIPEDTTFFSGWHNTTSDDLYFDKTAEPNGSPDLSLQKLKELFVNASENCRKERAKYLPIAKSVLASQAISKELEQRAKDWSELRPEWGLARNASFIVGSRELTRNLNLEGRAFLHDYDPRDDHDLSKLELIMTAPMIVTNWINMQYYASTIDPIKYGTGNKVLNNVTSGIGCIQGNQSDLLTGLSEQSVWYKGDYFHEPLRLQVFIQANTRSIDKIREKHSLVDELMTNGWLNVVSIDPHNSHFRLFVKNSWINITEDVCD